MHENAGDKEADILGQIGLGLGMQIVVELVDRVGDAFLEIHTEQTAQQDGKERLIRHLIELAAAHELIDVEAIAHDHDANFPGGPGLRGGSRRQRPHSSSRAT